MNREIKFRAWDEDAELWRYFTLYDAMIGRFVRRDGRMLFSLTEECQFTGLRDKNGKGIYEEDVFRTGNGRLWVVKFGEWKYWENGQLTPMFGFYASSNDHGTEAQLPLRPDGLELVEVIGNIYENPKLLKN